MLRLARLIAAAFAIAVSMLVGVDAVLACTGDDATLTNALRGATSIYYARITAIVQPDTGFATVDLDVGEVVRGDAPRRVHLINAEVCSGLNVGESGLVVLGSVDPFGVGPSDVYNFFFVVGPGHTSRRDITAALSPPETDTASRSASASSSEGGVVLALVAVASFLLVATLKRPPGWGRQTEAQARTTDSDVLADSPEHARRLSSAEPHRARARLGAARAPRVGHRARR